MNGEVTMMMATTMMMLLVADGGVRESNLTMDIRAI